MKGLDVGAGVVDAEYWGPMEVLLINYSEENVPFQINPGDRMGQLILECIKNLAWVLIDSLPVTSRGIQGFGSTGLATTDLGCGDPMVIPVGIKNNYNNNQIPWKPASAIIDSGASTQFIDPEFGQGLGLQLDPKLVPESLTVVDGSKTAPLTHTCTLDLLIDQYLQTLTLEVTKLAGWQTSAKTEKRSHGVPGVRPLGCMGRLYGYHDAAVSCVAILDAIFVCMSALDTIIIASNLTNVPLSSSSS